jgi:tetratricopeptide (TPR) repeat protein
MKTRKTYKIALLCGLFIISFQTFGKEKPTLSIKEIANQAPENRISYLFSLQNSWKTEPANFLRLDSLKNIAKKLNDDHLLQHIILRETHYKIIFSKTNEQKDSSFRAFEKLIEQSPYKDVKADFYFRRGLDLFHSKDFVKSLPILFQAKKMLEESNYESFPYSSFYFNGFFEMYYYFEDFKSAAYYCQLAIKNPNPSIFGYVGFYNNLGLCYIKLKEYDKAEAAFQDGIKDAERINSPNFKALIVGNLGNVFRKKGQFKDALPYLYQDATINEKSIPENAAISRMYIANALLHLDSVEKAKQFMKPPDFKMPIWTWPGYDLIRFETFALYHQKTGNFKLSTQFKDSLIAFKDTLKNLFDAKKLTVLEASLVAEKNLNDKKALAIKAENEKLIRNILIAGLAFLFVVVVFWLNNRRKQEKLIEAQKQQRAEEMLAQANKQLEQYLANIKEKNDLIESISSQIQESNLAIAEEEKNNYLENLQKSIILTDDNWSEFKAIFERIFPNFFKNLHKKYPDLTAAEIRLLALEELHLPDKDMGIMLGISADSVRKTRYRLRKKHSELLGEKDSDESIA